MPGSLRWHPGSAFWASATTLDDGADPPVVGVGPPPGETPPEGLVVVVVLVDVVVGIVVVDVVVVGGDVVVWVVAGVDWVALVVAALAAVELVVVDWVCLLLPPQAVSMRPAASTPMISLLKSCISFGWCG